MAYLFFIGTASGKTSKSRFHSSILISTSDYNLLVDAGDGISKAFLVQNIDYNTIDGVILTHLHPDHYTGLASLIVQMTMCERRNDLDIFVNSELKKVIKNFITNSYLYTDRLGFDINYHSFNNDILFKVSDEINFKSRQNSHLASVAEIKENSGQSFSCSSFLFNVGDKKIFYTSDVGSERDLHLFDDYKYSYLVSEITHIQPERITNNAVKDNSNLQIIFTHYSDENIANLEKFIANLGADLKSRVILAFDRLKIEL